MSRSESGNLLPLSSAGHASVVRPGSICLLGELIDGRESIRVTDADEEECRVVSWGGPSWRETVECALRKWLPKHSTSGAGPRVLQRRGGRPTVFMGGWGEISFLVHLYFIYLYLTFYNFISMFEFIEVNVFCIVWGATGSRPPGLKGRKPGRTPPTTRNHKPMQIL